mmetsp:Transcript_26085/g.37089  ORF Transcript_26085/g.37089 Transcript_26085/m.37089 type:complete len:94 (+) Transcript_26085:762-1043(+)
MLDSLTILQENCVQYEQWEWVDYLLNGIDQAQIVLMAKSIIRFNDDLKANFRRVTNKLSEFIVKETSATVTNPRHLGGRQISTVQGRGEQGRG